MIDPYEMDGKYLFVVHPSMMKAIIGTPQQRWKAQYRKERMKRSGRTENFTASVGEWRGFTFIED